MVAITSLIRSRTKLALSVVLACLLNGCTSAPSEISVNNLTFRITELEGQNYISVSLSESSAYDTIYFPTQAYGYVVSSDGKHAIDGSKYITADKVALWTFEEVSPITKDTRLLLRIRTNNIRQIVIDVTDDFDNEVKRFAARNGIGCWKGHLILTR